MKKRCANPFIIGVSLTKDEVKLGQLSIPDFLVHGVGVVHVRLGAESALLQHVAHLLGVVVERRTHRDHHALAGTQPERPLPGIVLGEDGNLPLHGAEDGPGKEKKD